MLIQTDPTDAFTLMSVFGLAVILDQETAGVRLWWRNHEEAVVTTGEATDEDISEVVHRFAVRRSAGSWITTNGDLDGAKRAPLSPRIGTPSSVRSWEQLQVQRHATIDAVGVESRLDRRMIGSLGEPAYWAETHDRRLFVDYGANSWEMKTRNRGEEFLQNRMSLLAASVAARSVEGVRAGLTGELVRDEAGKDAATSRTPTGLRSPGRTDNAQAWCALWGISLFPVRPVMPVAGPSPRRSRTGGVVSIRPRVWFGLPLFSTAVSVARVRSIARSAGLTDVVHAHASSASTDEAMSRLRKLGVAEVRVFEQFKTENKNAPEPWLLPGVPCVPASRA